MLMTLAAVRGINVDDRLTDNSALEDDYRFHEVFHLAFATYLLLVTSPARAAC
jgi:hypothetical protein